MYKIPRIDFNYQRYGTISESKGDHTEAKEKERKKKKRSLQDKIKKDIDAYIQQQTVDQFKIELYWLFLTMA